MIFLMMWSWTGVFWLNLARKARVKQHQKYMERQYVEMPDEEPAKAELFVPKPVEMRELKPIHSRGPSRASIANQALITPKQFPF
mmetsp:Transcript_39041/g.34722  ORF Transcript_39041/g.34722 Transcript_39041/m.34722 type:complete len:85 (-) Transcript_39041:196-450(-)